MKLLVTSIGQRSYLLDYFREGLLPGEQLLAADASPYASGLSAADRGFVIPHANDPAYEEQLCLLCAREKVDAVLTINDLELPRLATAQAQLAQLGTRAIVSSSKVVEVCFDKYATAQFLEARGFACPKTYIPSEVAVLLEDIHAGAFGYPVLAKPRRGSRSQGIYLLPDASSLAQDATRAGEIEQEDRDQTIYQEFIDSDQYSLHILNDFSGRTISVVGLVNLVSHVSGESFQIVTDDEPRLLDLGWRLGEALGHVGPACVDVHKRGDQYVILEINPRFGGGYPASHFAGADFTGKVLAMARGEELESNLGAGFKPGVVMMKQYTAFHTTLKALADSVTYYT